MTSTTDAAPPPVGAAGPVAAAGAGRRFRVDQRYLAPILITLILIGTNAATGMLEHPLKTGLAIVTAIGFEVLLSRIFLKKWPHMASAYITGISVGILTRSPYYWPFFYTSALSVMSKYLFKYKGRHIFNPSNFGIVTMLTIGGLAFYTLSIQWDNSPRLMIPIWCVGLLVLYRLRRLHITVTYILSFIFFAALRTPFTGHSFWAEVAPLTGPMYQLFAMFMVTDPPTTVSTRRGQVVVVFLVAAVESLLRLNQVVHAPYYALFLVGPSCLVIDRWRRGRQPAPALAPARSP